MKIENFSKTNISIQLKSSEYINVKKRKKKPVNVLIKILFKPFLFKLTGRC